MREPQKGCISLQSPAECDAGWCRRAKLGLLGACANDCEVSMEPGGQLNGPLESLQGSQPSQQDQPLALGEGDRWRKLHSQRHGADVNWTPGPQAMELSREELGDGEPGVDGSIHLR